MSRFFDQQLTKPLSIDRRLFSYGMSAIAVLLTGLALLPLSSILFEILRQGLPNLKWEVLTNLPAPVGEAGLVSGFANAIQGTALMVGLAVFMSVPLGVL